MQLLNDKEVYGAGLARNIEASAKAQGLEILSNEATDKNAANFRSLAPEGHVRRSGLHGLLRYHGQQRGAGLQGLRRRAPGREALRPRRRRGSGFAGKEEGIPAEVAERTKVTIATLSPDQYPPEGQEFFEQYSQKYGEENPDPYAIYGYETMALALDAITRSETGEKADIVKALFETKDRASVLGTYSIDANGDTTLTDYGIYAIKDGELVFDKTIKAK